MDIQCRKCPYFDKGSGDYVNGFVVLGFCKLRDKHVSDTTIGKPQCKDRAVFELTKAR